MALLNQKISELPDDINPVVVVRNRFICVPFKPSRCKLPCDFVALNLKCLCQIIKTPQCPYLTVVLYSHRPFLPDKCFTHRRKRAIKTRIVISFSHSSTCTSKSFETRQDHFVCSTSRKKGKEVCPTHFIRAAVLEELVLWHLQYETSFVAVIRGYISCKDEHQAHRRP